MLLNVCSSVILVLTIISTLSAKYQPTWESLDQRPLPAWFDEVKFGIMIHWGVFSVPSLGTPSEWFWYSWKTNKTEDDVKYMKNNYPPDFEYAEFAPMFTAEMYDPNAWADLFKASGAKYIVFTAKHHEGFCNWPTKHSWNWNSMDTGPHRDLVGELATAIRNRTDIHFGLYHSLFEWYNPLFLKDKANNYTTQDFVWDKTMPELYELVNKYKPEVLWSDGWFSPDYYWNSTDFIAWLYNESPVKETVVTNDRWGNNDILCKHGDFYTCDDKYNPGYLMPHKWESCQSIDNASFGFRKDTPFRDFFTPNELIEIFAEVVSCGGNLVLNVGATHDGRIIPIFEERLRQMGEWLKVNGPAIYKTKPWKFQNDTLTPKIWYTSNHPSIYAIVLKWPSGPVLSLGAPLNTTTTKVSMLGYPGYFKWTARTGGGIDIQLPVIPADKQPTPWHRVLKLDNLLNR